MPKGRTALRGGNHSDGLSSKDKMKKRLLLLIDRIEVAIRDKNWCPLIDISWDLLKLDVAQDIFAISKNIYPAASCDMDNGVHHASFPLPYIGIDWAALQIRIKDVVPLTSHSEFEAFLDAEIKFEEDRERSGLFEVLKAEKLKKYNDHNGLPMIQGKWRKTPYADRSYVPLDDYVVTSSVSPEDAACVLEQLQTSMREGFAGPALNCDDQQQTEEWMRRFRTADGSIKADTDTIVRWQVDNCMEYLLGTVQDMVCNGNGVLRKEPIGLGPQLKEVPVWGIDCYTRRNIELVLCESMSAPTGSDANSCLNDPSYIKKAQDFIEQYLLPSVNSQITSAAHDILNAATSIAEGLQYDPTIRQFARILVAARELLGPDHFRIYPKGTGVICQNPEGIMPHVVVSPYLGEVYPPFRWCEKLAVLEKTQTRFGLKPTLPDFYNILLERHRLDPDGYGILFVDASQRANMGSSCSHSCNANCTSSIVVKDGRTQIVLTTNRFVRYGEELTMDYYSVTSSEVEWRAAICLCGMRQCRGSFLHFSTQAELQQVLNKYCSPLYRFASLATACSEVPIDCAAEEMFRKHGMLKYAIGENVPQWMKKYAFEILKFVEYERKSLPSALFRNNRLLNYNFFNADSEARCVMESRLQAIVISFSVVRHILKLIESKMASQPKELPVPVRRLSARDAVALVWENMRCIPDLLETHIAGVKKGSKKGTVPKKSNAKGVKTSNVGSIPVTSLGPSVPAADGPLPVDIVSCSVVSKNKSSTPRSSKDELNASKLMTVLELIRGFIRSTTPSTQAELSKSILRIREMLKEIRPLSNAHARIQQLQDVLVLWAHTLNFLIPNEYLSVECVPVEVFARELGNDISRSAISSAAPKVEPERDVGNELEQPSTLEESAPTEDATTCERTSINGTHSILASSAEFDEQNSSDSFSLLANTPIPVHLSCEETPDLINTPNIFASAASDSDMQRLSAVTALPSPDLQLPKSDTSKFEPNEVVHVDTITYNPLFIFWQLMGWFNAGSDDPIVAPDVFGSLQLPLPVQCFGVSEIQYGNKERELLRNHILDEFKQSGPWPTALKRTFSKIPRNTPRDRCHLMGSPFLDILLGVGNVNRQMSECFEVKNTKQKNSSHAKVSTKPDEMQFDEMLPPESSHCTWVMCHLCTKWRRVAWYIDPAEFDSNEACWTCSMNYWDESKASCTAEEDYDPSQDDCVDSAQYDMLNLVDFLDSLPRTDLKSCPIGSTKDVYCVRNKQWFKGKILSHFQSSASRDDDAVRVHFLGWKDKFDETIEVGSGRIQPLGIFTERSKVDRIAALTVAKKHQATSTATATNRPSAIKKNNRDVVKEPRKAPKRRLTRPPLSSECVSKKPKLDEASILVPVVS